MSKLKISKVGNVQRLKRSIKELRMKAEYLTSL